MSWKTPRAFIFGVLILSITRPGWADITAEQVRESIRRGVAFLKSRQQSDGSFDENPTYPGGRTALATLALIQAGEDVESPTIERALEYLRSLGPPTKVYSAALQTMVFCAAEPEVDARLIRQNADWLQSTQKTAGVTRGGWGYSGSLGDGDPSNSQFALLGLYEAERVGVRVQPIIWQRALAYWLRIRREDGSWGYFATEASKGSMTCAGISSVIICSGKIHPGDAKVVNGNVQCCCQQTDQDPLHMSLQWLGRAWSVRRNPGVAELGGHNLYYYLYGLERAGRLTGRRFIARHDWYREGASALVELQDGLRGLWRGSGHENVPVVATSFALLFLSKGRRPVVIGKLKYGTQNEWDLHRDAVGNVVRRVEQRWRQDLTWQTIDIRAATVEDLLETPVLYISGRESLDLIPEQRQILCKYVEEGGFIFAEACCGGAGFDRDFRRFAQKIGPLRPLPPEHAVWFAEQKVEPLSRPLYGIEACCRTSVVYCPKDELSCYWELSRGDRDTEYPEAINKEIETCLRIGANVVTYATNRELKNKLDRPQLAVSSSNDALPERGVLYIPKLKYRGGGDDVPNALPNMLAITRSQAQIRIGVENRLITATDPSLYEYPLLFMHGRRAFRLSAAERKALAAYVDRGGVIFADAICASPEFAASFRREMEAIFPDRSLVRIPPTHSLFTRTYRGFDLSTVTLRDPQVRSDDDPLRANLTRITPRMDGLEIEDRLAVIFSPYDISCALEKGASLQCKGYIKEDAARLAVNVLLFMLQQ